MVRLVLQFAPSAVWQVLTNARRPHAIKKKEITMPQANNPDFVFYLFGGIVATFFLIILLAGLVSFLNDFSHELKYINCEIQRNIGAERRYWIRKRRRLWLSLIPFVKY